MPKMKPETHLPLEEIRVIRCDYGDIIIPDEDFILHACNTYPKLVKALREASEHIGCPWKGDDLLKELGEL